MKVVLTNTLITPESNRESIQRSVRDWLSDNYIPDDREIYFKICFALKLSETDAQNFMRTATDGGFHVRNPRELAYLFCLRTGKTYTEAQALFEKLTPLLPAQSDSSAKTELVVNTFSHVATEEQFLIFYDANITALGKMHNTAYEWFCHLMNVLISPSAALYAPEDRAYSMEEVVNQYLRMDLPLDKRTSEYTLLQRTLRRFWPNATSITKMRNHKIDVSRKVLLLLFLVTEGGADIDSDLSDFARFEEQYWRLKIMLNNCGISPLDPRNEFDWIVLHSLKTKKDEAMNDRMQEVLGFAFGRK